MKDMTRERLYRICCIKSQLSCIRVWETECRIVLQGHKTHIYRGETGIRTLGCIKYQSRSVVYKYTHKGNDNNEKRMSFKCDATWNIIFYNISCQLFIQITIYKSNYTSRFSFYYTSFKYSSTKYKCMNHSVSTPILTLQQIQQLHLHPHNSTAYLKPKLRRGL